MFRVILSRRAFGMGGAVIARKNYFNSSINLYIIPSGFISANTVTLPEILPVSQSTSLRALRKAFVFLHLIIILYRNFPPTLRMPQGRDP